MIRADPVGSRGLLVPHRSFKHRSDKTGRGLPCRWDGCFISVSGVPLKRLIYKFAERRRGIKSCSLGRKTRSGSAWGKG